MIKDLFHTNRPTYSLEVFPPKKDADVSVIYDALDEFKTLHPSFISVTYGAGGNTAENTFAIASYITGTIANKNSEPTIKRLLCANFIGLGIVYLFGMVYYYIMSNFYLCTPIGLWPLFLYCFILAVPGDILLCILGAILGNRLVPIIKKKGYNI